jgi:two-component system response regulator ChvI
VRQGGVETPVIFLTTLTDQIYEESALASGAVDFVEKSRSFVILLKRIELILNGVRGQPRVRAPT